MTLHANIFRTGVFLALLVATTTTTTTAAAQSVEFSWNQLTTSGPTPIERAFHSAVYDPIDARIVVFGGWSNQNYNSQYDTWALDLATHRWSQVATSGGLPARRAAHVAVYDSQQHRMIIHGGDSWWTTTFGDTWSLDFTTGRWQNLATTGTSPGLRWRHAGIFDPSRNSLFVFGGRGSRAAGVPYFNDVYQLDLTTLQWSQVATTGVSPAVRGDATAVLNSLSDEMIVFGGYTPFGSADDIWALNLATGAWRQLTSHSRNWNEHSAVMDEATGRMIVVSNNAASGPDCDAAVFDAGANQWPNTTVNGSAPSWRRDVAAIFDPARGRVVMFGGFTRVTSVNETWELELGSYFRLAVNPDPLLAGRYAVFSAAGGVPSATSYLAYSLTGPGSTAVPSLGITLGLDSPKQVGDARLADATGEAVWALLVPSGAAGLSLWFQAAQFGQTTDVVATSCQ